MQGLRRAGWTGLGLAAWLLLPVAGRADPVVESAPAREHCPHTSYSPLHYWTPALYRLHACLHGPKAPTYAPDRFPCVPPTYKIIRYPCPAVDPATLVNDWRLHQ